MPNEDRLGQLVQTRISLVAREAMDDEARRYGLVRLNGEPITGAMLRRIIYERYGLTSPAE